MPEYQKLVRDRIPEIISAHGETAITRVLDDEEYELALIRKIEEEQVELASAQTTEEKMEELADLQELIFAAAQHWGSIEQLEMIRASKAAQRGRFLQKIFLERTI